MNKVKIFLKMIKFEHSIFAMPFAYTGMLLASRGWPRFPDFLWITVAMVGARTSAMTINRLVDAEIDKVNPRTSMRALPAGLLGMNDALIYTFISMAVFLLAVYNLAPICRVVWPLVVIPFVIYPYTKRFTWLCHIWLGIAIGIAPVAAWVAIRNGLKAPILLLGLAVMVWIAGFDVLYATQDIEHDRRAKIFSIPARFGIPAALNVSKLMHLMAVILLTATGIYFQLGVWFYIGVAVVAGLLAYENNLVRSNDLSRLNAAFFTMNGVISFVVLIFTSLDILVGG